MLKKIILIVSLSIFGLNANEALCERTIDSTTKYMKKYKDTTNPITKEKVKNDLLGMLSMTYEYCKPYLSKEQIDKALAEGAAALE